MHPHGKDYYRIMGVSKNASQDEIHAAFIKLTLQYRHLNEEANVNALCDANAILSDPTKRSEYDRSAFNAESHGVSSRPQAPTHNELVVDTQILSEEETLQTFARLAPSSRIVRIGVDHNVVQNSRKGMLIHLHFALSGMKEGHAQVGAYFDLASGQALKDMNNAFKSSNGHVCVFSEITSIQYDPCEWKDYPLFMPYDELHLPTGRKTDCRFHAEVFHHGTDGRFTRLATSEFVSFFYGEDLQEIIPKASQTRNGAPNRRVFPARPPARRSASNNWLTAPITLITTVLVGAFFAYLGYGNVPSNSNANPTQKESRNAAPYSVTKTARRQSDLAQESTAESRAEARELCKKIYLELAQNLKPENTDSDYALFVISATHSGEVTFDDAIRRVMSYKKYNTVREALQRMRPYIEEMAADPVWFNREIEDRLKLLN